MDAKWILYRISWHFALIFDLTCIEAFRDSDINFRTLATLGINAFCSSPAEVRKQAMSAFPKP